MIKTHIFVVILCYQLLDFFEKQMFSAHQTERVHHQFERGQLGIGSLAKIVSHHAQIVINQHRFIVCVALSFLEATELFQHNERDAVLSCGIDVRAIGKQPKSHFKWIRLRGKELCKDIRYNWSPFVCVCVCFEMNNNQCLS